MDWHLDIKHDALDNLYANYLFQQNRLLTFYLSTLAFEKYIDIDRNHHKLPIRASNNFEKSATSIQTLGDIQQLVNNGEYSKLSRSLSIFGLVTAFENIFGELKNVLNLDNQEIKRPITLLIKSVEIKIRPASLKIACLTSKQFNLDSPLTTNDALLWMNCIINLRHMFVHNQGIFDRAYDDKMHRKWTHLNHGDEIVFDENEFDSILWYLNSHLKPFVLQLSERLG